MACGIKGKLDSIVTNLPSHQNFVQLAWLTSFSVTGQIFHSLTAQASAAHRQKSSHTYQWPQTKYNYIVTMELFRIGQ